MSLSVLIVNKSGEVSKLTVKEYNESELYKKCGFKSEGDFQMRTEWSVRLDGTRYLIQLFAKTEGRAGMENKYDFPPPVDTALYFGSCVLVGLIKHEDKNIPKSYVNLTLELWEKIYEKLFGGFEDLALMNDQDEEEEDELADVDPSMLTKSGYLKDGFVVSDSSEDVVEDDTEATYESEYELDDSDELSPESYI